jgi:hypothetical protein
MFRQLTLPSSPALLPHADNVLEALAKNSGVVPLMHFFSAAPDRLTEFADDQVMSVEHTPKLPSEKWFSAEDGLNTVIALKKAIIKQQIEAADKLIYDLSGLEKVLKIASANQIGWHLAIDY